MIIILAHQPYGLNGLTIRHGLVLYAMDGPIKNIYSNKRAQRLTIHMGLLCKTMDAHIPEKQNTMHHPLNGLHII